MADISTITKKGTTYNIKDSTARSGIESLKQADDDFTADIKKLYEEISNLCGGDGLTGKEKTLILSLFKNAAYTADMSATIEQLETLWSGGDVPDEPTGGDIEVTGDEDVVVTGATDTDDGNGNVTVIGLTATDDGNGNIIVS